MRYEIKKQDHTLLARIFCPKSISASYINCYTRLIWKHHNTFVINTPPRKLYQQTEKKKNKKKYRQKHSK